MNRSHSAQEYDSVMQTGKGGLEPFQSGRKKGGYKKRGGVGLLTVDGERLNLGVGEVVGYEGKTLQKQVKEEKKGKKRKDKDKRKAGRGLNDSKTETGPLKVLL